MTSLAAAPARRGRARPHVPGRRDISGAVGVRERRAGRARRGAQPPGGEAASVGADRGTRPAARRPHARERASARRRAARRHRPGGRGRHRGSCCWTSRLQGWTMPRAALDDVDRHVARRARLRRAPRRARHAHHLPGVRADPGARLREDDRRRHAGGDPNRQASRGRLPRREGSEACCSLTDVSVHYGRIAAVNDLSLEVNQGELVGLVGHNGAGKSTTLMDDHRRPAALGGADHLRGALDRRASRPTRSCAGGSRSSRRAAESSVGSRWARTCTSARPPGATGARHRRTSRRCASAFRCWGRY